MKNNSINPGLIYDNVVNYPKVVNPTASMTVDEDTNIVICGGNSLVITLAATSNSPVYVSSIDGTTQRTGCTVKIGDQDYVIADGGCVAHCIRYGDPSANQWLVIGAKTAS
jgi:hypothetical protein